MTATTATRADVVALSETAAFNRWAGFEVVELAPRVEYADVVAKTGAPVTDGRQRCNAASSARKRTPSLA